MFFFYCNNYCVVGALQTSRCPFFFKNSTRRGMQTTFSALQAVRYV